MCPDAPKNASRNAQPRAAASARRKKCDPPPSPSDSDPALQKVLEAAPVILFAMDARGMFTRSEGKGLEGLDLQPGEAVGQSAFELYRDYPEVLDCVRRAIAGEAMTSTFQVNKAYFEVQFTPVPDTAGKVREVVGVAFDVTAHVRMREALQASELRFRSLIDAIKCGIQELDIKGTITYCNRTFAQMTGYSERELIAQPVWNLCAEEEERRRYPDLFETLLREQPEPQPYLGRNRRKDGTVFDVEIEWNYRRDPSGKIVGFTAVVMDITERNRAQQRLQLLAQAVEQVNEGIAVADLDGHILLVNSSFAATHGYRPEELVGQHIRRVHTPEQMPAVQQAWNTALAKGAWAGELWHARRDGSVFPTQMNVAMFRNAAGQNIGMIGTLRDISEQKKVQQEKAHLQAQLYQVQKLEAIGQLAGGVAHDFNNLLAVILGNASIVKRNRSLPPKVREALSDIVEAAERGSALTQQLLTYARGGLQERTPTDLNRLVGSVLPMLERTAAPGLSFEYDLATDLAPILADPPRIEQVVMNLCLNAIQASRPPAVIRVRTSSRTIDGASAHRLGLTEGHYALLEVADEGAGIDPAVRRRVFEPFFTTKEMGRGLGLSVTLSIVQSHGGQILIDSHYGQGTTVSVYLPLADRAAQPVTESRLKIEPCRPPRGSETVLILDDDDDVASTCDHMLSTLGYCVVVQADADKTLAFLASNSEDVDLLICDRTLPNQDGLALAERVVRDYPHIAVLLTSSPKEAAALAVQPGDARIGLLSKPFNLVALAETVRTALDQRGGSRPAPS